jgi:hypothetical protein
MVLKDLPGSCSVLDTIDDKDGVSRACDRLTVLAYG